MSITENAVENRLKTCFRVKVKGSIRELLKEKYGIIARPSRMSIMSKSSKKRQSLKQPTSVMDLKI
jgi:hypothetical protein